MHEDGCTSMGKGSVGASAGSRAAGTGGSGESAAASASGARLLQADARTQVAALQGAAAQMQTEADGRFHRAKVSVAPLLDRLKIPREEGKAMLLRLHRAGAIELSSHDIFNHNRGPLFEAERARREASAIPYLNTTYHLVRM